MPRLGGAGKDQRGAEVSQALRVAWLRCCADFVAVEGRVGKGAKRRAHAGPHKGAARSALPTLQVYTPALGATARFLLPASGSDDGIEPDALPAARTGLFCDAGGDFPHRCRARPDPGVALRLYEPRHFFEHRAAAAHGLAHRQLHQYSGGASARAGRARPDAK